LTSCISIEGSEEIVCEAFEAHIHDEMTSTLLKMLAEVCGNLLPEAASVWVAGGRDPLRSHIEL
jgi:hypothetical protein